MKEKARDSAVSGLNLRTIGGVTITMEQ